MATKLKNLKIKRVALVDEGANPDAFVRFAKSKDEPQDDTTAEITPDEAQSLFKRLAAIIAKAFGTAEPTEKAAYTFAEGEEKRDYERIIDAEIYPMQWAFMDSVRSILTDNSKQDDEKTNLLKVSLNEYSSAFGACLDSWAKAEPAKTTIRKDEDALRKMRDNLNHLLNEPAKPGTDAGATPPAQDGAERPVEKGAKDMIFDTEKMTAEERATFDDLAKRFGSEETEAQPEAPAPETPATPAEQQPEAQDEVYKGLHPTVKAELESLRKFRESAEMREYTEIAKKYTLLGKKPEELAPVLKSLKDAGGTAYTDMLGILDSNLAAVEKSGVFDEVGKRGGNDANGAWAKIEAAAQEIVKSKPGLSWADAIDTACMKHPELVQEYEKSR